MKTVSTLFFSVFATAALAQPQDAGTDSSLVDELPLTVPVQCRMPQFAGRLPDGTTPSASELLAVQGQISEFIRLADDFITCVNDGLEVNAGFTTEQRRQALSEAFEYAGLRVDEVVREFSTQVAALRAASGPGGSGREQLDSSINPPEWCRL